MELLIKCNSCTQPNWLNNSTFIFICSLAKFPRQFDDNNRVVLVMVVLVIVVVVVMVTEVVVMVTEVVMVLTEVVVVVGGDGGHCGNWGGGDGDGYWGGSGGGGG